MNKEEIEKYISSLSFEEKLELIKMAFEILNNEKYDLECEITKLKQENEILQNENIIELKNDRDYYKLRFTELNKNWRKLINELLGEGYYNMGCDWYTCDKEILENFLLNNDGFDCQECGFGQKKEKESLKRILNYIKKLEESIHKERISAEAQTTYEVNEMWKKKIENKIGELKQLLVDPQCAENVRYRIYELEELLNEEE